MFVDREVDLKSLWAEPITLNACEVCMSSILLSNQFGSGYVLYLAHISSFNSTTQCLLG